MKCYKTFEGMITAAFEEKGLKDDNGNLIKATEQPMNEQEFAEHKRNVIKEKVSRLTAQDNPKSNE